MYLRNTSGKQDVIPILKGNRQKIAQNSTHIRCDVCLTLFM